MSESTTKPPHTIMTARFPLDAFRELKAFAERYGVSQSEIIVTGAMRELQRRKETAEPVNAGAAVLE